MTQLVKSAFSTAQLPRHERFAAWQESFAALFDVSLPDCHHVDDFHANLNSYLFNDQIVFGHCSTSSQRFERGSLRTARDGLDYYLIQTHVSGSQQLKRGSKMNSSQCGDLMVIDLAENHLAETTDFSNLTLIIPRPLLAPLLLAPDSQEGRNLKPDTALTALAVNHLRMLAQVADSMTPAEAADIIDPTLKLIAGALNGSVESIESGTGSVATTLLGQAKLTIEKNLTQNLSVNDLCRALGLSRTRLYAMFEPLGGIRHYIQDRRLRRCAEALMSPHFNRLRIYEIAYRWGFTSEAHFSRAFKQKFGITPSEARQEQIYPKPLAAPETISLVGDRYYEQWVEETLKF